MTARQTRAQALAAAALLGALAALALGCTRERIVYRPQASLGTPADPLPLRVELRALEDASPAEDRVAGYRGTALTSGALLSEELAPAVTRALLEGWRSDGVFQTLGPAPCPTHSSSFRGRSGAFTASPRRAGSAGSAGWCTWTPAESSRT